MKLNRILISITMFFVIIVLTGHVKAESISTNKSTVQVGDTFTITISGINGQVTISSNDKVSLSNKGTMFLHGGQGPLTITGTAKSVGTGTISLKFQDATTSGANPKELTGTKSVSVTVKEKEQPKEQPQTTKTETKTQTTAKKTTTTNTKKTEQKKKDTKTKATEIVPTEEKEEATPEWGISQIKVVGIKDNDEKIDIELDKQFNINTYEYSCNVSSDVKKVEILREAYEYNDYVTISGAEEELHEGENIISVKLAKDGQKELIYTIKVNKEKKEETEEVVAEVENNNEDNNKNKIAMITMPVWSFVIIEIILVAVTAIITFLITKKITKR